MQWLFRILILAALVVGGVLFHASRANRPQRVQLADEKGILLLGNGTDIETLDPHMATGQPEHWVISAIFEGLVGPAEDNPDLDAPGVAESWESADFQTWTFKLRSCNWSDGVPITAQDFVYAWNRMLSPDLGANYAEMLHILKNAANYHQGKTQDFTTVGVQAVDDHTLKVILEGPAPYFPSMLKHYAWFPVPRHAIEKFGKMTQRDTPWARPGNIVSNGAFQLKDWRINHFIAVERNPQYWDAAKVGVNEIHFFPINNAESEERVFLDGQLHLTYTVPLAKIPGYRQTKPSYFHQDVELAVEYYRCNVTRAPLDNQKVRQALSLALDRDGLLERVIRAGHPSATGLTPPGASPDYPPLQRLRFDPVEARRLLAEAGYPNGKGFRKIEILTNSSGTAKLVAEFFQECWKNHLGIEVGILQQDWQVYLDSMRNLTYDVARAGWVGDYTDPFTFLSIFRSFDGNNNTGWKNARYDELMLASTREPDVKKRMELMREGENLMLDEMPGIPVFWRRVSHLQRPELLNWRSSVISHRCYKNLRLGPYQPLTATP